MKTKLAFFAVLALIGFSQVGCAPSAASEEDYVSVQEAETSYDTCVRQLAPQNRAAECDNAQSAYYNTGAQNYQNQYYGTPTGYSGPAQYPYTGYNGSPYIGYGKTVQTSALSTLSPTQLKSLKTDLDALSISTLQPVEK